MYLNKCKIVKYIRTHIWHDLGVKLRFPNMKTLAVCLIIKGEKRGRYFILISSHSKKINIGRSPKRENWGKNHLFAPNGGGFAREREGCSRPRGIGEDRGL